MFIVVLYRSTVIKLHNYGDRVDLDYVKVGICSDKGFYFFSILAFIAHGKVMLWLLIKRESTPVVSLHWAIKAAIANF